MHKRYSQGFTVVEILATVIVVAILATLMVVGYNAVTRNANEASMKSDLKNAVAEIGLYRVDNKKFPDTISDLNGGAGLSLSGDNEISYVKSGPDYCLSITSPTVPGKMFSVTRNVEQPVEGGCPDLVVGNGSYMQTINSFNCPGTRTRAVDARDMHTYWVQKLADGKCWMLTNLSYAGGGANDYDDVTAITSGSPSTATAPRYYAPHTGASYTIEPTSPSTATDWTGQYGYLYNWCAAMGSQIGTSACSTTPVSTPAVDSNISACPAGWRLPTGHTSGEHGALNSAVNSGSTTSDSGLKATWLAQYGGVWNGAYVDHGNQGYYWSSSIYGAPTVAVWRMQISNSTVNLTTATSTGIGMAVRCVTV